MGLLTKGNKRGVGAALLSIGQSMEDTRKEKAAAAQAAEVSAREERRLQMQEADAKQRQEMNELKLHMSKAQWNNEQLMKSAATSEFNPKAMGPALTQYMPDGLVWDYNELKSNENEIVFDMGTYQNKGAGVAGVGGVPTKTALPGGLSEKRFVTNDQYTAHEQFVNWIVASSNPNAMMAMTLADLTGDKQQARAKKIHDKRMTDDKDYALKYGQQQELDALKVRKARAEVKKLEREPTTKTTPAQAPVSTFTGVDGKQVDQTAKDVEKAKAFSASLNKTGEFGAVDPNDAARIMQLKDNPNMLTKVEKAADMVAAGKMSDVEFMKALKTTSLPEAYLQTILDKAGAIPEDESEGFFRREIWSRMPFVK